MMKLAWELFFQTKCLVLILLVFFVFMGHYTNAQNKNTGSPVENTENQIPDSLQTVDVHPQDSPEDRGFLLISKDKKSSLRLRGSVRLNGGYDLNGLQTKATFSTYDIPVGDANNNEIRYFMSINQTRLGLKPRKKHSEKGRHTYGWKQILWARMVYRGSGMHMVQPENFC